MAKRSRSSKRSGGSKSRMGGGMGKGMPMKTHMMKPSQMKGMSKSMPMSMHE